MQTPFSGRGTIYVRGLRSGDLAFRRVTASAYVDERSLPALVRLVIADDDETTYFLDRVRISFTWTNATAPDARTAERDVERDVLGVLNRQQAGEEQKRPSMTALVICETLGE